MHSFLQKLNNCPSWCLVFLSGILVGLTAPGRHTQLVGMISLLPLFLVMDRIPVSWKCTRRWKLGYILMACWGTGSIAALIGVPWLTYAARVFGQLSWPIALLITGLGYGLEITMVLFVCFGLPILVIRQRGYWDLLVRLSYFLMVEPFCPRLFHWSFGGMTFTHFPWLPQLADIIGSAGLGIYSIGFNLLLLLVWRWKVEQLPVPVKLIRRLVASYLVLWTIGLTYGMCRIQFLDKRSNRDSLLHIASLQPNFSFQQLASNAIDYSTRQRNIRELLEDSVHALGAFPVDSPIPKLVIWPESTYPSPYFKDVSLQPLIKHFARRQQASVLFHSIDWDETPSGRKFYGIALLIGPDGEVKGRYNKICRIPFGEYIPGADLCPPYAKWIRNHISNLSEFEKGKDFTVFHLSDDLLFSAPICFDVFSPRIIRNMSRNGAKLAINLSNLIWFGRTTASDHLEMTIRWKAIEHRIPIFLTSNNGKSVFINALGTNISEQLGLFEKGSLSHTISLKCHFSLNREYMGWVYAAFALVFVAMAVLGYKQGKTLKRIERSISCKHIS